MTRQVHGATIAVGGTISDQATAADLEAVQQPGTHVGTPTADFTLVYRGQILSYRVGDPIIAEPLLYAAMSGMPVTWSD